MEGLAPPTGVFVRRAEFDDQVAIQALIGEESHLMAKRFGAYDIAQMIENASLGITAVDERGQVVGYAAFYDYPALTPEADPPAGPTGSTAPSATQSTPRPTRRGSRSSWRTRSRSTRWRRACLPYPYP